MCAEPVSAPGLEIKLERYFANGAKWLRFLFWALIPPRICLTGIMFLQQIKYQIKSRSIPNSLIHFGRYQMRKKFSAFLFAFGLAASFSVAADAVSDCENACYVRISTNCHAPGWPYGGICVSSYNACVAACHR